MRKMRLSGDEEEGRNQRDLFTVVECMLCIIPESAIALREELEDISFKLSFPSVDELVYLDREIALALYDHYEDYKKYMWMKIVISLYFNKNVSEVLDVYKDDIDDIYISTDINNVKTLCDRGIYETLVDYIEGENALYIKLKDKYKKRFVTIGKFQGE